MAGDASWASVATLLHFNGTNGATSTTDNAPTPKTYTFAGNAQLSTAQKKFGSASLLLDGNGDYLSAPYSAEFDFPGDFTIEAWVYLTGYSSSYAGVYAGAIAGRYLATGTNTGWQFALTGTASAWTGINVYTGLTDLNTAFTFNLNQWYHVAISRSGSSLRIFVDGALVDTKTNSDSLTRSTSSVLYIGAINDTTYHKYFPGYIDDLRITKGVARYTAAFTAPTEAFQDGLGQVSGNVKDAAGSNAARTVRAYRRDTGALVASTTSDGSGNYSFYTPTLDELTVIALDDQTSGTYYDDQAIRVIPA